VHVCGLEPGKTYYYQAGGGSPEVWSETHSFTTVPSSGKIVLGVSGDSRDSSDVMQLVQSRMKGAAVNAQLFSGDFVVVGTVRSEYTAMLDKMWKDPSGKLLTLGQQLFLPVAGNHENEAAQFYGAFALPGTGTLAESFASFDIGNTHFVLFDDQRLATDPQSDATKTILAYLDADLGRANAARATRPFIVVVQHRGIFSTSKHGHDSDIEELSAELVPIWDKHKVDVVLSGHDHNYERSKPLNGPAKTPTIKPSLTEGTTYVVCAGAGAGAYAPGTEPADFREKNQAFGGATGYVGVYGLLTLENRSLGFKAYGLKTSGGSVAGDDVVDSFDIVK
jgi:predicted phosphodiesterase